MSSPGRGGLRTVLFDMDGLLVDSEPLWFEVDLGTLREVAPAEVTLP